MSELKMQIKVKSHDYTEFETEVSADEGQRLIEQLKEQTQYTKSDPFFYKGEHGGSFLFDRKLTENELLYNRLTYVGTMKEINSDRGTKSISAMIKKKMEGAGL